MKPHIHIIIVPVLLAVSAFVQGAPDGSGRSSQVTSAPTVIRSDPPPTRPQPVAAMAAANNYRIAEHDVLIFKVFQEEDLETTARVAKDGTISFPLIGYVQVGGKTVQEAAQTVQDRLREYLVHPQVTIRILEYSKRRFTVLGQVSKPGTYDLPDDSTINLLEAIGMAGGYTRIAQPSHVTVKRVEAGGRETTYKLDAKRMAVDKGNSRFEIVAGDTIVVGESLF